MKKSFITPILLFVTLVSVTYFGLPQYQKFKDLKEEVAQKKAELSAGEAYFANLRQTSETLKDYQDTLEKIKAALPQELSLANLLNFFQKKSSESGLLLKNVTPTKKTKKEAAPGILAKVEEAYFGLNLVGSYSSLKEFLKTLEKSSRLIEVESISLDATVEEKLPEYNILIKVYHE